MVSKDDFIDVENIELFRKMRWKHLIENIAKLSKLQIEPFSVLVLFQIFNAAIQIILRIKWFIIVSAVINRMFFSWIFKNFYKKIFFFSMTFHLFFSKNRTNLIYLFASLTAEYKRTRMVNVANIEESSIFQINISRRVRSNANESNVGAICKLTSKWFHIILSLFSTQISFAYSKRIIDVLKSKSAIKIWRVQLIKFSAFQWFCPRLIKRIAF